MTARHFPLSSFSVPQLNVSLVRRGESDKGMLPQAFRIICVRIPKVRLPAKPTEIHERHLDCLTKTGQDRSTTTITMPKEVKPKSGSKFILLE
jgi:hypothetical protein